MNKLSLIEWLTYMLLRFAQLTPFRGNGNSFTTSCSCPDSNPALDEFHQAKTEAIHFMDFFTYFKRYPPQLGGKVILDLGSGYGGRTLEYKHQSGAAKVVGVEPFDSMVQKSIEYAQKKVRDNCEFRVCSHLNIPAEDDEFDAIVSYDVIEHVQDPEVTIKEMRRVLRVNGEVFIVFTPYWGALSHHLNYITRLPFIHWVFSATTLVNAVNHILASEYGKKFGTAIQPLPQRSFNGKFMKLPTLNGLDGETFLSLARSNGFEVVYHRYTPLAERFLPWAGKVGFLLNEVMMRLHPKVREGLSFNLVCVLRKNDAMGCHD
jgi:SAM-dependent methyltransferase